jgi:FKBP-type peptidyl-prolyl cis-trans isomerase FkpA
MPLSHQKTLLAVISSITIACSVAFAQSSPTPDAAKAAAKSDAAARKTASGLTIIDNKVGDGQEITNMKPVLVHYTGWLLDEKAADKKGKKFDSSKDRGAIPFGFFVGAKRVIPGWEEGVLGMKPGGQRTLIIPPELGYGSRGAGEVIPPNATLLFEIEFVKFAN